LSCSVVSFPSTLLMVMLITWVVLRRFTEEVRGFFLVESRANSATDDDGLLSMWRFVLGPDNMERNALPPGASGISHFKIVM